MSATREYIFTGGRGTAADRHPDAPDAPEPYVASEGLIEAVNLAIYLRRPLLLEGEAGSGKSRLARAIAYELGLPFYPWHVRSTSRAQDGLYSYDAIRRLHDVHLQRPESPSPDARRGADPSDPAAYRTFGPLGRAFQVSERPAVVLIDEIDKADIDFPNDLLAVLDDPWMFEIPETGEEVTASQQRPIVVITSNKEKGNLPAPFLRRCLYYFVEFPDDEERLRLIVEKHYETHDTPPSPGLVSAASRRFLEVRREGLLHKKPGTSEFLDWVEALRGFRGGAERVPPDKGDIPYPEVLFKLRADWQRYVLGK